MLKIYTWTTPNGYKPAILLEELGESYELVPINITKGEQKTPEFLAINPNGKIPALVDEDAEGGPLTIFESGSMLEYLAEKAGKKGEEFYPSDARGKYLVNEWVMFQNGGIGPMFGQLNHFVRFAPEKVPYAITRYTDEVKRLLGVLDTQLSARDYLAGEYSIADIMTWPWVRTLKDTAEKHGAEVTFADYPNVERWYAAIDKREAVQRALEKVDAAAESAKNKPKDEAGSGACAV